MQTIQNAVSQKVMLHINEQTINSVGGESERFAPFAYKMLNAGLPELVIRTFQHYYTQLVAGATGYIPSKEAEPVYDLPDAETLGEDSVAAGRAVLDRAVVLKLNGGLGTSMGMDGPKSLLEVKDGLTFLDILVRQVLHLRTTSDTRLPLLFMNSFITDQPTVSRLTNYPQLKQDVPMRFLQHKEPKVLVDTLQPVQWPRDPEKEWCPPGHGDLYPALVTSGMLTRLLQAGYEYLFVSNSDNLGATLDLGILGYFAANNLPFLMEVADRTAADNKGGHLARRPDGRLILRELAQCPPSEEELFQNIHRYRYFNTNNLWLHLPSLQKLMMDERGGILGLPLIRNEKPVDPRDVDSPRVYQLETAMGSAISVFPGAQAVRVARSRFVPVKKNNDLLLLMSDAYRLTDEYHLELMSVHPPIIELDHQYYRLVDDVIARFPYGPPSLRNCTRLHVQGDVCFGRNVVVTGDVQCVNRNGKPMKIADGTRIDGAKNQA